MSSAIQDVPLQVWKSQITPELVEQYHRDGVIFLRQAIHPEWLSLIEIGIRRVLASSSPYKFKFFEGESGEFLDATRNFATNPEFQRLLFDSPIADMLGRVIRSENVWLLFDHVFVKEGGHCKRTPWHQDLTYWPVAGTQLASMWITLDPIPKHESLEFVAGSHLGPLYDGFNPSIADDPTAPYYGEEFPRLPDIEAERGKWNIVSWAIEPGDVVIFHPGLLHGGGQTNEGRVRRTLSVRCFGNDVVYATRPASRRTAPATPGLSLQFKPGDLLRHPLYPKLRPVPDNQRPEYYT
jgi:ectoine hydroxylase-related dioxygenase (phytanoyl-CoA dioxygenase family)